jgi:hypothetical protein
MVGDEVGHGVSVRWTKNNWQIIQLQPVFCYPELAGVFVGKEELFRSVQKPKRADKLIAPKTCLQPIRPLPLLDYFDEY